MLSMPCPEGLEGAAVGKQGGCDGTSSRGSWQPGSGLLPRVLTPEPQDRRVALSRGPGTWCLLPGGLETSRATVGTL